MVLREVGGDGGDFAEEIEVGGERTDSRIDKHEVLDEQHQLFREGRTVAEEKLHKLLELFDELVGCERRWIDRRPIEAKV